MIVNWIVDKFTWERIGIQMDIGVVIALSVFGLGGLLAVLMGIIAAISAVTGINITSAPHQEED